MKPSSLFSPSSWRKKKRSPSTQVDHSLPTSPVSSTFQQSAPSSLRCSLSERAEVNSDTFSLAYPLSTTEPRPLENGTRPPRRPPRPPGLDLHAPLLQSSASCPSVPVSPKSPRTPKHDLCAPPLSPSHSCPPMRYGESEQSHSNSDILKSKRSMPQLDGVWKGFLKELDEDPLTFQLPSNLAQTHSHHNSQPRCRGHRSVSSSIPKSKSTHDLSVHADMSPPGRRNKPLQRSPFSEPLYTPLSSPKPNRPKLILSQTPKDPLHELDEGDLTLSFPAPPPLFIRRKVGPLPALKPRSDTPPSPAMCSSTSSSDSTPVATPTTATPTQSSPKIPPLMITKKSSSSVIAPLSPTASIPSPSSPRDFSDPRSRSLRLIQSISDLPSSRSRAPGGPKMSLDRERDLRTVSSARRRCSSQKNPKPTAETQYPYSQNPPQGPLEWDVGVAF